MNWYCVYTKPKHEEKVCKIFSHNPNIEILSPKLKKKKYIRGKVKEIEEFLFPNYIFLKFDMKTEYKTIKYTSGVRRLVGEPAGKPAIVGEDIITLIKSNTSNGYVYLEPPDLKEGDSVIINDGYFAGLEGVFVKELKANERVLVLLNSIQSQLKIDIDKCFLQKQR